jgi:hypothetical protein
MAESDPPGEPIASGRCPWCSAPLAAPDSPTCPACGAALQPQLDGDVPGVTQIDAAGLATQRHDRGKGVRSLIGLADEDTEGSAIRSVPAPPSDEVRREMLRLRIDALEAEIEAQAASLAAASAEGRTEPAPPDAEPPPPDAEPPPPDPPA